MRQDYFGEEVAESRKHVSVWERPGGRGKPRPYDGPLRPRNATSSPFSEK